MDVISFAICFFIFALVQTVYIGLFLPAFFVLCYMLPFMPLMASSGGLDIIFWPVGNFQYAPESIEVFALSQVWLASSLAVICGLAFSHFRFIKYSPPHVYPATNIVCRKDGRGKVAFTEVFVLTVTLIVLRIFMPINEIESSFAGFEMITCLLLLLTWTFALVGEKVRYFFGAVLLTLAYACSQMLTGDRDFFSVIIAVLLVIGAINNWGRTALLGIGIVGAPLVVAGTLISMVRMDVVVSVENTFAYMAYNSWNATILPVILMIQEEWEADFLLYGKSYIDLMLSVLPSPFYRLIGWDKPIAIDNPATWFYIEGLGGMHVSGVALRNFGLAGVFIQVFLAMLLLARLELRCRAGSRFWPTFLYLCVGGALMHAVWYSLISMVNALIFFVSVYMINFIPKNLAPNLRNTSRKKVI